MPQIELKTFDDAMRLLPHHVEYSRAESREDGDEGFDERFRTQSANAFMAIVPMLNYGMITLDEAEQFRLRWEELTGYHVEYEKHGDKWALKLPEEGEVMS